MTISDTYKVREQARSSVATQTNVPASSTVVTLLAANTNRYGATLFNDSAVACFVKLGSGASATSFSVKMAAQSYYELPFAYVGIVDGIWETVLTGAMRISELT